MHIEHAANRLARLRQVNAIEVHGDCCLVACEAADTGHATNTDAIAVKRGALRAEAQPGDGKFDICELPNSALFKRR